MTLQHQAVMVDEAIEGLALQADGCYVDGTYGRGGHSQAILAALGEQGRLLVIDQDPEAIASAKQRLGNDPRVVIRYGSFTQLQSWVTELGWLGQVNGVLLDIGVSSPQLDDPERGFSFKSDGPLDMRMNPQVQQDAASWIAQAKEREIIRVLREYGEERFARRIAHAIVEQRQQQPIRTTLQLAKLIAEAVPRQQPGKHPATRSFQAIRIVVNCELEVLEQVLAQSIEVLAVGGHLVVISFHSLEDGLVKRFIQHWASGGMPPDLAVTEAQLPRRLKPLGRLIRPSDAEVRQNPRARSARCRMMEKLK